MVLKKGKPVNDMRNILLHLLCRSTISELEEAINVDDEERVISSQGKIMLFN